MYHRLLCRANGGLQAFIPPTEGFKASYVEDHPPLDDAIRKEIEKEKQSITFVSGRVMKYVDLMNKKKI